MRTLLLGLVLLVGCACSREPSVVVDGEHLIGKQDVNVKAFLGVPYAEPPLDELRWRTPQALAAKVPRRDVTQFAPACMQTMRILDWYRYMAETFGGSRDYYPDLDVSEDCLYLNIWTPTLDRGAKLPVVVWVHGGSNISGWAYEPSYHGQALANEGVVVVSVAYRVGLFGFMSHPGMDATEPATNFGLWDIVAALRWIQANIDAFGGDPGRVTLFGESSGAHNIVALIAAKPARDLFRQVVGQSTPGIASELQSLADARQLGVDLARAMGFEGNDTLRALREASANILLERYVAEVSSSYQNPVLDGLLFERSPWDTLTSGDFGDVSLILGTNANEWWDYVDPDSSSDAVLKTVANLTRIDSSVALEAVRNESNPRRAIDRLRTADEYLCPSQALATMMNSGGNEAWVYYFSRIREDDGGKKVRAYHGAESAYVFNTHDAYMRTTETDVELTHIMQDYWTNFAATGNPNSDTTPDWPVFESPGFEAQEFGDTVQTIPAPEANLCAGFRWE